MQQYFEIPDVLTLVTNELDFKDARKFPMLSKTTRDAVVCRRSCGIVCVCVCNECVLVSVACELRVCL